MTIQTILAERLAKCEKATPGPWGIYVDGTPKVAFIDDPDGDVLIIVSGRGKKDIDKQALSDAKSVVCSRNQRPGEIRALQVAVEALEIIASGEPDAIGAKDASREALHAIQAKLKENPNAE